MRARDGLAVVLIEAQALLGGGIEAGPEGFLEPLELAEPEGVGDAQVQHAALVRVRGIASAASMLCLHRHRGPRSVAPGWTTWIRRRMDRAKYSPCALLDP